MLMVVLAASAMAQTEDGYNWIPLSDLIKYGERGTLRVISDVRKDVKIKKVALKKVNTASELFSYYIYFSESPNGEENGHYRINTIKLSVENGSKKNKIKIDKIPADAEGWHVYDFGKELYLLRSDMFNQIENIRVLADKPAAVQKKAEIEEKTICKPKVKVYFSGYEPEDFIGQTTPLREVTFDVDGGFGDKKGYLVGFTLYRKVYTNEGKVLSYFCQLFGPEYVPIPALQSDTIIAVEYAATYDTIKYKNGDFVVSDKEQKIIKASIHRNGGVLTIRPKTKSSGDNTVTTVTLTYPNGDRYFGGFYEPNLHDQFPSTDDVDIDYLSVENLGYWNGVLVKADGTQIKYKYGKSDIQIAEEERAKEAERKAIEAKRVAIYKSYCKKYGKKYVDAAMINQTPIVGMSEKLLKEVFHLTLAESGRTYKKYRITGTGFVGNTLTDSALLYTVWVSNGKVTCVISHRR